MKIKRHAKIIEIVNNKAIETQEELVEQLMLAGFAVTQATISRDIRELKLTKRATKEGVFSYAVLPSASVTFHEGFLRIFRDGVLSIQFAQNIVVIKTLEGIAMGVAACIDAMDNVEMLGGVPVLGSIAGDDCIFCLVKTEDDALLMVQKLQDILKNV